MKTDKQLATEHVTWFLKILKPLLIDHMIHGIKHGKQMEKDKK